MSRYGVHSYIVKSIVLGDGVDAYLDLGGHTLTLPKYYGVELQNAHLAISNGTLNCTNSAIVDLIGSADPTAQNYTTLTISDNVIVKQVSGEEYFVSISEDNVKQGKPYGIVVNFNGTYEGQCPFYIHGSLTTISENAPTFNIGKDAEINSNSVAYAAGYGIWNHEGKAEVSHHGIEIRAGKLTMNGGSIECTATEPADDQFNGSGSTSQACGIAVCQHSTKLPIEVVVNNGYIKAYTPLYQANPQNNGEEINDVKLTVNDGLFFSTSNNIVWALNKRIFLNGGVYNMNPSAYVAEGKAVVENTTPETKEMYPYAIGTKAAVATTIKAGDWNDATIWSTSAVPTTATPVVIAHNVVVPANTKAEAFGVEVKDNSVITIEGALAVGNDGIKGITDAKQLLIKDGGAMVISPAATENNQPLATVYKKMNIKHKDAGTYIEGVESPYLREHIGLPTIGKHTTTSDVQLLGRQWNTSTGWEDATEFATAFKGYSLTSEMAPTAPVAFAGQLVGNMDATISMSRGFHFVGNSWVAPINTTEILNQVGKLKNENAAEAAIKVYLPTEAKFEDINLAKLKVKPYKAQWGSLASMQAFFLYANRAATITLSYEQAVWNALLAQPKAAAKRVAAEDEEVAVRINLTAKNGRTDYVYVYEGEEFHSTKMMNEAPNVNIYVEAENGNYSTFGTADLEGTALKIQTNSETEYTLSFEWIEGETLAIKDLETGAITAMTEGNTYTFTATANTTTRRFAITRKCIPSSVESVTVNSGTKGVYSITGQFLGEDVELNTLPQGIYVVDGQKYIK